MKNFKNSIQNTILTVGILALGSPTVFAAAGKTALNNQTSETPSGFTPTQISQRISNVFEVVTQKNDGLQLSDSINPIVQEALPSEKTNVLTNGIPSVFVFPTSVILSNNKVVSVTQEGTKIDYTYGADGKISSYTSRRLSDGAMSTHTFTRQYDSKGRLLSQTETTGSEDTTTFYTYQSDTQRSWTIWPGNAQSPHVGRQFFLRGEDTLDSQGRVIKTIDFVGAPGPTTHTFEYQGNNITEKIYYSLINNNSSTDRKPDDIKTYQSFSGDVRVLTKHIVNAIPLGIHTQSSIKIYPLITAKQSELGPFQGLLEKIFDKLFR